MTIRDEHNELREEYQHVLTQPEEHWPEDVKGGLRCINKHLDYPELTVGMVREKCLVGNNNFSTRFKHYVGMSPKQYITRCRIAWGVQIMRECAEEGREISMLNVALTVGYRSQSSFSKAFKRVMGVNPEIFQETIQEEIHESEY
ncbi:MAG: helix-turn-helix transcriptional regulator [Bacteroidota bacterium]